MTTSIFKGRTIAKLTDDEPDALIKSRLAKKNPALAERFTSKTTCAELNALFDDALAELAPRLHDRDRA
jgi:hypothetical protein